MEKNVQMFFSRQESKVNFKNYSQSLILMQILKEINGFLLHMCKNNNNKLHTHTHTHIYIYIYIYSVNNFLTLLNAIFGLN